MNKNTFLIIILLTTSLGFSQIPTGYYDSATGNGFTLKTQLHSIISNNTNALNSSSNYGGLWTLFTTNAFRDTYYENDNSLLDVYSEKPTLPDSYNFISTTQQCGNYTNEGDCYNREHTVPQSFFGNSTYPMYSDAHFVLPTDGKVNAQRDDYPYGKVNTVNWTSTNGSKLGPNLNSGYSAGYTGIVFEPIDEFKGDIARCLFYFVTNYENQLTSFYNNSTSTSKIMFDGSANHSFSSTFLNILLKWHLMDPVSPYEIGKNNAVYLFQGNRNPYIDHPEYVCQIWATECAALSNESFIDESKINLYPNPSYNGSITIESTQTILNIKILNINGQIIREFENPLFTNSIFQIDNLPKGFFLLKVSNEKSNLIKKINIL